MNLRIDYPDFVRQLSSPCKRQPPRPTLLKGLIGPLQVLPEEFNAQRDNSRMMINVNSQVKVLEEYLRKKYNEPVRIKITTYNNVLLLAGLLNEGRAIWPEFGLIGENCFQSVPLENEVRDKLDDADLVVCIPLEVDKVLIKAETEKYRQALTIYRTVQR